MSHPYTFDTRRPLLMEHEYWVVPNWNPGTVWKIRITQINTDRRFYGKFEGKLMECFQARYNCDVFTNRAGAERAALEDFRKYLKEKHKCPFAERDRCEMLKKGIAADPVQGPDWSRWQTKDDPK